MGKKARLAPSDTVPETTPMDPGRPRPGPTHTALPAEAPRRRPPPPRCPQGRTGAGRAVGTGTPRTPAPRFPTAPSPVSAVTAGPSRRAPHAAPDRRGRRAASPGRLRCAFPQRAATPTEPYPAAPAAPRGSRGEKGRGGKQPPEPCRKMREAVCLPAGDTTLRCSAAAAAMPTARLLLLPARPCR